MAANNFKPFATGAGANVLSQADWESLTALATGFTSGKASSAQVNKALRQATTIAAIVAQFMSDQNAADVLDNGDTNTLQNQLRSAITAYTPGRLLAIKTFTSSGTYTPTAGTKKIRVRAWGGGGGGGGVSASATAGAAGGSSGAYVEGIFNVTGALAVSIGAGGAAGTSSGGNGGAAGSTSLGSLFSATGGFGGGGTTNNQAGQTTSSAGTATGGNVLNLNGSSGRAPNNSLGGSGGSAFSTQGGEGHYSSGSGTGGFPGSAGGGANGVSVAVTGGAGASGYLIIEEYA